MYVTKEGDLKSKVYGSNTEHWLGLYLGLCTLCLTLFATNFFFVPDNSDVALGYRSRLNGWSYCNFAINDVDLFGVKDSSHIRVTDHKNIYTLLQTPVNTLIMYFCGLILNSFQT
jgi:hypothetical protein